MTINFYGEDELTPLENSGVPFIESELAKTKNYGSKNLDMVLTRMKKEEYDSFLVFLKSVGKPLQNQYNKAKVAIELLKNPFSAKVGKLENLDHALKELFSKYMIHGYLFKHDTESGQLLPYSPTQIKWETPRGEANYWNVTLQYYSKGENKSTSMQFSNSDIRSGASVIDLIMDKGYVIETPELVEVYFEQTKRFMKLMKNHGQQYTSKIFSLQEERRWGSSNEMIKQVQPIKMVNNIKEFKGFNTPKNITSNFFDGEILNPVHPLLPIFVLHKHKNGWVHVENATVYKYNPNIKEKLILHPSHEDLIDAIAETYTIDMNDIIDEKSGGTIILGTGDAGVGKTLTAEVTSEVIQKPLYKVNVSLFGTKPDEIEERLQLAFDRANSWGAILLLDEADLYIMERDTNIQHNAIVTVFLKGLEYSKGLTFMTTNKGKNVDEAILSRCTAVIRYSHPDEEARRRLWDILSKQFDLTLSPELMDKLTERFPKASGRDIKMLCILVFKYTKAKNIEANFEIFEKLSVFRGLDEA